MVSVNQKPENQVMQEPSLQWFETNRGKPGGACQRRKRKKRKVNNSGTQPLAIYEPAGFAGRRIWRTQILEDAVSAAVSRALFSPPEMMVAGEDYGRTSENSLTVVREVSHCDH